MPDHDPTLQGRALRYAARDLGPADAAAFEAQLATDPAARDALAEAVRLSAAALGQEPPAPHPSFRRLIVDRLRPLSAPWFRRRAYPGHPLAWVACGVVFAAGLVVVARELGADPAADPMPAPVAQPVALEPVVVLPVRPEPAPSPKPVRTADAPTLRTAEIWAELSTPDRVEKAHEDDQRFRRLRDWHLPPSPRGPSAFEADAEIP
jgi:hypothetical protein